MKIYAVKVRTKDGKREALLKTFRKKKDAIAYADRVADKIAPPYPSRLIVVGENQFRFLNKVKKVS